jgi:hypothetical protein
MHGHEPHRSGRVLEGKNVEPGIFDVTIYASALYIYSEYMKRRVGLVNII